MSDSFDIATEGLLQSSDGQCLKTVVRTENAVQVAQSTQTVTVAREAGGALVAAGVAAPVTVTPAPTEQISAERIDTQVIIQPGCGSAGSPGVSSWNDLLDKPTEFPPEDHLHSYGDLLGKPAFFPPSAHIHAIDDVTGLEPRIFVPAGIYTFDCDPLNADEGITDPFEYKTASAMFAAVAAFMPLLPKAAGNEVIMRFADGEYDFKDLADFAAHGAPVGSEWGFFGTPAQSNCIWTIQAKTAPSAIADGAWSAITSDATEAAQRAPYRAANEALIRAAYKVRFTDFMLPDYYYLNMPGNGVLDGVAVISTGYYIYAACTLIGPMGAAFHGAAADAFEPSLPISTIGYERTRFSGDGAKLIVSHCDALQTCDFISNTYDPAYNNFTLCVVNPNGPVLSLSPVISGTQYIYNRFKFLCIGNLAYKTQGWIAFCVGGGGVYIETSASSVGKTGEVVIHIQDAGKQESASVNIKCLDASPTWNVRNNRFTPAYVADSHWAAFAAKFPSRIGAWVNGNLGYGSYSPSVISSGVGDPNGWLNGRVGDMYQSKTGEPFWVKQSGNNTNTGWVAVSANGHEHVLADISDYPAQPFSSVQNITIDIDSANADNGITDPYLFKDAIPAYDAAFIIAKRMAKGFNNSLTLLLGNGDYSITDLNENFLQKEKNPDAFSSSPSGAAVSEAYCTIRIKAKNDPSVISSGAWTPVLNGTDYDVPATWAPIEAANRALVEAAFNVRFYFDVETGPYPYGDNPLAFSFLYVLKVPANMILDGVAFVNPLGSSDQGPDYYGYYYADILGSRGLNGYAILGTYSGYSSAFKAANTGYEIESENIDVGEYGSYVVTKPAYIVDGSIGRALKHDGLSSEFGGAYADTESSDVLINTTYGIIFRDRPDYSIYTESSFYSKLTCIGVPYAGYAYLNFYTTTGVNFFAHSSSSAPSGTVLFDFTENPFDRPLSGATSYLRVPNASKQFVGVSIRATRGEPVTLRFARGIYEGRFTGGLIGNWIQYNQAKAVHFTGSGNPNGVFVGDIGDLYSNTTGGANTTLWVKESGNNTNTGWVAK